MKKNKNFIVSVAVFSLFSVGTVSAELAVLPRIQAGIINYDISLTEPGEALNITEGVNVDISNNQSSNGLSDSILMLGAGLTLAQGNYFADVYYQQSASGELSNSGLSRGSIVPENIGVDRDDFALSLGRSFGDFVVGFGYKSSETEFDQNFTILSDDVRVNANLSSSFKLDGPFVSFAYGRGIGPGVLSAKIAIADLTGDWDINQVNLESGADLATDVSGDATGITFGLVWKAPINDQWSYSISADYYDYDFDVSGTRANFTNANGQQQQIGGSTVVENVNLTEEVSSLNFALIYTF